MPNVRELVAITFTCYLIYKYIVYPVFVSPLSKIPNAHFTSSVSSLWILWTRHQFKENRTINEAHERHGPVVRLGPNEISVNCVDNGLRSIYAGGFEKHEWYPNLFANYNGVPNMFSTIQGRPHSVRKRMLSNIYSKSYLQSSASLSAISNILICQRLLPKLSAIAAGSGTVEVHRLFNTITMDFVTAYIFGLCNASNFIQDAKAADWWLGLYQSRKKFTFWPQEMSRFTQLLSNFGIRLSPKWVADANHQLEQWCLECCDLADQTQVDETKQPENIPNVYRQLKTSLSAEAAKSPETPMTPKQPHQIRLSAASELLDELSAGEETSAITLTYLFHELCLKPELQQSLRSEARTLSPSLSLLSSNYSGGDKQAASLPSCKSIDSLPLLHATLMETLRLHTAIPGPQPRITPHKPGLTLGTFTDIPGDVRVSSLAYSLHRNPEVFPDPETFQPERWMTTDDNHRAEMHRWFWAFSSGGRMCIGSNFAMLEMKLIVAVLLSNFQFSIVDDQGIEQEDAYTAQPTGQKLLLRIQPLEIK